MGGDIIIWNKERHLEECSVEHKGEIKVYYFMNDLLYQQTRALADPTRMRSYICRWNLQSTCTGMGKLLPKPRTSMYRPGGRRG